MNIEKIVQNFFLSRRLDRGPNLNAFARRVCYGGLMEWKFVDTEYCVKREKYQRTTNSTV